jgi:chromosomal replication initiation ATPase DnaA
MTTFHDRLTEVCLRHSIPADRILSHCRRRRVAHARQDLMHALRGDGWPLEAIGEELDRDHTSVLYGVRAHEKRRQEAKQ